MRQELLSYSGTSEWGESGRWSIAWTKPTTLCRVVRGSKDWVPRGSAGNSNPGSASQHWCREFRPEGSICGPNRTEGEQKLCRSCSIQSQTPCRRASARGIRGYGWCGWCTPLPFKEPSGDSILSIAENAGCFGCCCSRCLRASAQASGVRRAENVGRRFGGRKRTIEWSQVEIILQRQ